MTDWDWLVGQDAEVILRDGGEYGWDVYVVAVDDVGLTLERDDVRWFCPWTAVRSISIQQV